MSSRDIENIKNIQIELTDMKTTMYEILKNTLDVTKGILDIMEEEISEFEDRAIETIENETQEIGILQTN